MIIDAKCRTCSEPTKYATGFFDGENGEYGCLYDCKNTECLVNHMNMNEKNLIRKFTGNV